MLAEARPSVNNSYNYYKLYRNYRNSARPFFNPRAEAEEHVQLPLGQARVLVPEKNGHAARCGDPRDPPGRLPDVHDHPPPASQPPRRPYDQRLAGDRRPECPVDLRPLEDILGLAGHPPGFPRPGGGRGGELPPAERH